LDQTYKTWNLKLVFSKDWLPDGFMSQSTTIYSMIYSTIRHLCFQLFCQDSWLLSIWDAAGFWVHKLLEKFSAIKFYSRKSNPHLTKSSTMSSIEVRPSSGTAVTENPGKVLTSKMNSKVTKIENFHFFFTFSIR
jgi:hypothetical protein